MKRVLMNDEWSVMEGKNCRNCYWMSA